MPPTRSRLDSLVSAFPLAIIGLNPDGRVAEWNTAATQMFGWSSGEAIGGLLPTIPAELKDAFDAEIGRAFRPTTAAGFSLNETQWLTRGGDLIDVALWTSPLRNRDGFTTGLLLVASDISGRVRVEKVLQQAFRDAEEGRALLDTVISEAPVGIALFDSQCRFVRVNATLAQMNGFSVNAHKDVHGSVLLPDLWPTIQPALKAILEGTKEKVSIQLNGQTAAAPGITRTWIHSFYPIRIASGQVTGAGVIVEEITLQRRATVLVDGQKLALEMMAQDASLSEVLGVLTSIVEEQSSGRCLASILLIEDGLRLRHGAAPSLSEEYNAAIDGIEIGPEVGTCGRCAYLGVPVVTPDIEHAPSWAGYEHLAQTQGLKAAWSMPIFARSGEVIGTFATYFRETREPTLDEWRTVEILSRTAAVAIERTRAEEALRESEQRFRVMANGAPVMIWVTDAAGACTYLNSLWHRFTGQLAEEGFGDGWLDVVHEEDREESLRLFAAAMRDRLPLRRDYRIRRHDGEYSWVIDAATPRFSESGEFLGFIGSVIDISDRKRMEEELLRSTEQLKVANAAKDEFLGLVSHELRTPITVILGQSDLLTRKAAFFDADTRGEMVADIHRESLRLHQIIENLLALARLEQGQQADLEPVIIDRLLDKVVESFRKTQPMRTFITETSDVPLAIGSNLYIEQIMRNLLSNATKYSPSGEPITITARAADGRVVLSVRDRGPGIAPGEIERVFAPFYRSNDANFFAQGFGIGLAVCKRLAGAMNASIWVEAGREGGSIFSVSLERAEE
jgi:PAS domain S-box-containing protein